MTDFRPRLRVPDLFRDRYSIGLWVWDLQVPSSSMADAAHMVHEVWTPTSWGRENASTVFGGDPCPTAFQSRSEGSRLGRTALHSTYRMALSLRAASTSTMGSPVRTPWVP